MDRFTDGRPQLPAHRQYRSLRSDGLELQTGGFTAFTDNEALAHYDRETVWSTEAGIRGRAFDGKLRAQLTGYIQDIDNYQVERTFTFTDYLVVNAGEARSRGVELELSWEILHGL